MYLEDELLPLSGLQHLVFCERQWALIHIEQQWEENRLTAEGRLLHEKADEGPDETRDGVRHVRGLALRSLRLGISGRADVVEFPKDGSSPFPVEYKRGKPKPDDCDEVQICAQALCLEEMLNVKVTEGALYYGKPRHRTPVVFDAELRARTEALAARMQSLYKQQLTPAAIYKTNCKQCSLYELCQPKTVAKHRSAGDFLRRSLRETIEADADISA